MNYSAIEIASVNNGIGIRCVLWESGCEHHCFNCQNKETWNRYGGKKFTDVELNYILEYLSKDYVDGLTFSGGDPLAHYNIADTFAIAKKIKGKYPAKSIWCYTGYTIAEVLKMPLGLKILNYIDVLVDGEYKDNLRSLDVAFRGSTNQNIINVKEYLRDWR